MGEAARKLQQVQDRDGRIDEKRVQALMAALLELGAARDGIWDDVSVAALHSVAGEMAHRVACVTQMRSRLRGLEEITDVRECVGTAPPARRPSVPAVLREILQSAGLTASQRRYIATLYASDPILKAAVDDIAR